MSKPSELKVAATAANQPEGELIVARLAQAVEEPPSPTRSSRG